MFPSRFALTLVVLWTAVTHAAEPIRIHPENPYYFLWRGKPTALVSASEHYGSLINPAFDYSKYLETIAADHLNATIVFSGSFVEGGRGNNSLQPPDGMALLPWARSDVPGYVHGGNKFDLSRWDENYFKRLKAFVREAGERGIVVWFIFFTPYFDAEKWEVAPWNPANYVNGPPPLARTNFFTLDRHGGFLALQEKLVRRVVEELRDADNVIYEPIYDGTLQYSGPGWIDHITSIIADAQKQHPHRKLISRNFAAEAHGVPAKLPREVSILAWKMSDALTVEVNRPRQMPMAITETGFVPSSDVLCRIRAWDYIISGGAAFLHMDWTFETHDPQGRKAQRRGSMFGGGPNQRRELGVLNRFFHSLDFTQFRAETNFVAHSLPREVFARTLAHRSGNHYVTYLHQTVPNGRTSIRWTGRLTPKFSEEYRIISRANDGVRLWIDGKQLIDSWMDRGTAEDAAPVTLQAGKPYELKVEFFFNNGQGQMSLFWESSSQPREAIPASAFSIGEGQAGLHAEHYRDINFQELLARRIEPAIHWRVPPAPDHTLERHVGLLPLHLRLPPGRYEVEWLEPASLRPLLQDRKEHPGGILNLTAPPFADDLLLVIRK